MIMFYWEEANQTDFQQFIISTIRWCGKSMGLNQQSGSSGFTPMETWVEEITKGVGSQI